ncbi:hypothetical protein B0H11DRAFT_1010154 [Mycena galericulata]|nr:hypothetical protein B0H11DRAFT_1010154 [Mycena galericulata]
MTRTRAMAGATLMSVRRGAERTPAETSVLDYFVGSAGLLFFLREDPTLLQSEYSPEVRPLWIVCSSRELPHHLGRRRPPYFAMARAGSRKSNPDTVRSVRLHQDGEVSERIPAIVSVDVGASRTATSALDGQALLGRQIVEGWGRRLVLGHREGFRRKCSVEDFWSLGWQGKREGVVQGANQRLISRLLCPEAVHGTTFLWCSLC